MSNAIMYIDGAWTEGRDTEAVTVTSPTTGEQLGEVPVATVDYRNARD